MPRDADVSATSQFKSPDFSNVHDADHSDTESTSKLRGIGSDSINADSVSADSIDLDLDRLATALGSGDTVQQPRAAEEVFSSEVFEASQRSRGVDLDVGDALNGSEHSTSRLQAQARTDKLKALDPEVPELEPVTMSEVGTKLDLARALHGHG